MRITVGQLRRIIRETIEEETLREAGIMDKVKGLFGKKQDDKKQDQPREKAPSPPPPEVGMIVWYGEEEERHTGGMTSLEGKITSVSKEGEGYKLTIQDLETKKPVNLSVSVEQWRKILWSSVSTDAGPRNMPSNWVPNDKQVRSLSSGTDKERRKKASEEWENSPEGKAARAREKEKQEKEDQRRAGLTKAQRDREDWEDQIWRTG